MSAAAAGAASWTSCGSRAAQHPPASVCRLSGVSAAMAAVLDLRG
ncbi:hypothetical protein ACIQCD_08655 [Streptomyces sp. NPDC093250]